VGIRRGWCFSDGSHRWPVSDWAAEALTAMLEMERVPALIPAAERLTEDRVRDAVRFLLARQNPDGGFSTYEPRRGGAWLDRLNPSEMFRDCMTERSYVECTASAVEALAKVRAAYPGLMGGTVAKAIARAIAFLRDRQRPDGSFPGAWGINFTYAIFHVTKALVAAGVDPSDAALVRAVAWLRDKQGADGGWGEHFSSCLTGSYIEHPRSQAVMTGWALLALTETAPPSEATTRGMRWLASTQQADGSWPEDAVNGVFFGTAMLAYRLYRAYVPVWALSRGDYEPAEAGSDHHSSAQLCCSRLARTSSTDVCCRRSLAYPMDAAPTPPSTARSDRSSKHVRSDHLTMLRITASIRPAKLSRHASSTFCGAWPRADRS
jgi:squalene/oxidosqualene cyclase-like protein